MLFDPVEVVNHTRTLIHFRLVQLAYFAEFVLERYLFMVFLLAFDVRDYRGFGSALGREYQMYVYF